MRMIGSVMVLALAGVSEAPCLAQSDIIRIELPPSAPPAPDPAVPEAEPETPPAEEAQETAPPQAESGLVLSPETRAELEAARDFTIQDAIAAEIEARRRTAELNARMAAEQQGRLRAVAEERAAEEARRQAEYQAALDAHDAEAAEAEARYQAEMAEWRRRVAACAAGDKLMCGDAAGTVPQKR